MQPQSVGGIERDPPEPRRRGEPIGARLALVIRRDPKDRSQRLRQLDLPFHTGRQHVDVFIEREGPNIERGRARTAAATTPAASTTTPAAAATATERNITNGAAGVERLSSPVEGYAQPTELLQTDARERAGAGDCRLLPRSEGPRNERVVHGRVRRIVVAGPIFALGVPERPRAQVQPLVRADGQRNLAGTDAIVFDALEPG